jgi:hypothetical protein
VSLWVGWRTREVVQVAGGDFTKVSNAMAVRDGALTPTALLAALRSPTLHRWEPPGGTREHALAHAVIHGLDITEATGLDRRVPAETVALVLALVGTGDVFGVDLDGVELRANDLDWSGSLVTGPAQVLALVACGRRVPADKLSGNAAAGRFTQP